jgi:hypothetical protein
VALTRALQPFARAIKCARRFAGAILCQVRRYADPRIGLLTGGEWDSARPIICRTLGFTSDPALVLSALAQNCLSRRRSAPAE